MLPKINPTKTSNWSKLKELCLDGAQSNAEALVVPLSTGGVTIDFSKQNINDSVLDHLINFADEFDLKHAKKVLFSGGKINETENRAVLHTALRDFKSDSIVVEGENVLSTIRNERDKLADFVDSIHTKKLKGFSGKDYKYIVNIGIGGSDLGPNMVVEALKDYHVSNYSFHFVNNVDPNCASDVLRAINLEETLFIVVSKTFTTQETLYNADYFKEKLLALYNGDYSAIHHHFIGVSSNPELAKTYGIASENVFQMWDWVNGRFSLWSAVGISIALAIGNDNYISLLKGAESVDTHFLEEPTEKNIPTLMALLGIWHVNFKGAQSEAIIPYSQRLSKFVSYLQQAAMESNGKNIDRNGDPINYQTSPVIWGDVGTNAQHSFFQLLHQGTMIVPLDIIAIKDSKKCKKGNKLLLANAIAQGEALRYGKKDEQATALPHQTFSGKKPITTITLDNLTPFNLGALIALYEHKIFVQGVLWNVYSFDQWGVELGKQIAKTILEDKHESLSSSTKNLIKHLEI